MKSRVAGADPTQRSVRFEDAIAWQQRGDLAQADATCAELLRLQPTHADAWHLRGLLAFQSGEFERGIDPVLRSLAINPQQPAAHANVATALLQLNRPAEAMIHFERSLVLQPGSAATLYGRGSALLQLRRFEEALVDLDRALALMPTLVPALRARGQALQNLERFEDALFCFERVLALGPPDPEVHHFRGDAHYGLRRYDEALVSYDSALKAGALSPDLLNNRGNALRDLCRYDEALASYERALQIQPRSPETLSNRGNMLLDLNRIEEALVCYDAALQAQPDFMVALENRGLALMTADRPEEAAESYSQFLEVALRSDVPVGNFSEVLCSALNARCACCDWRRYENDLALVLEHVAGGERVAPFPFLALSGSAEWQNAVAARFVANRWGESRRPVRTGEVYRHDRLRVAYLSADFREHVVSFLLAGLFERHDSERVETIAVSLRPPDNSDTGLRVKAAFTRFIEVARQSDREVAELLRRLQVDVVVDLMGFTRGCRPGILSYRAAPVQVSYLGYPGTMGAPFIDYILADEFVIPPAAREHYSEQVVYLPECFQANDDRCVIGPRPSRMEAGLPEHALVLCCFNNNYKLNPPLFEIWMRLLREVPGSVLWLLGDRPGTQANLLREAAARGVDESRLIFAGRLPYAQHLGRLGLADLFLDTLPYNAGATASDALRCGVPVLTCAGEAFVSRMAGSLLRSVGLPELITGSLPEYERVALALLREPQRLKELRVRLAENLPHAALFDTERFCRHLESAYFTMHERAHHGLPPEAFSVTALPGRPG
jgi:protein O-GlcNAc transferase